MARVVKRQKPLIGVSACLSGEAVRYDAADKRQPLLLETLSARAELLPFCPEVAAGLGVPRPAVQLIQTSGGQLRARGVENPALDVTAVLTRASSHFCASQLQGLSGFILKSRSPSCGFGSTPVFNETGTDHRLASGMFAAELANAAPWLPIVEERALTNEEQCLRFLSACVLVARSRHGLEEHQALEAWLRTALGVEGLSPQGHVEAMVKKILAPLVLGQNEKTALGERLQRYWGGSRL